MGKITTGGVTYRSGFFDITGIESFDALTEDELKQHVSRLTGNFSIITENGEKICLVADRYQSFPMLYYIDREQILISDSISFIMGKVELEIDPDELNEFLAMGVCTGESTLYRRLKVVEAGSIVTISKRDGTISKDDYYCHHHTNAGTMTFEYLKHDLDFRLHSVFSRIKEQLGDRMVVVPLSGGYDSRLVVEMLKKVGIKNVLCISYGNTRTKEVLVAERLAKELGFRWLYVPQTGKMVETLAAADGFWPCMKEISAASAMPYLQNYVIKFLTDEGTIPHDAVIMTGNSGDVVEGDQMPSTLSAPEKMYSRHSHSGF